MKFLYASVALTLFSVNVIAQQSQNLPKGFSADELQIMQSGTYNFNSTTRGVSSEPAFPVRTMAQWEEVQSLVITWTSFPHIQSQMVDAAQEDAEVYIICQDSNSVKSYLTGQGVPLYNIRYLEAPFNSIWVRDYGAHTIYKNYVDSLLLLEWIYNRPRPDDDALPNFYASDKGIGLHSTTQAPNDLVNTGGNWMVDGFGTAFASKLILDENDAGNPYSVTVKTEAQIDTIMKHYMGIDRYIKMETLPYDQIHHIDMHMKLVNEETILMGEYPVGVADGPQIEANLNFVANNYNSVFGTPYKWVRIPQPPSTGGNHPDNGGYYRTYTNNVIVNKTVLVPFYREEYDTIAQRILEDVYPGYTIVGIDADSGSDNIISQSGAIHCISNLIGADNPLLISHQELEDTYDDTNPYLVDAFITNKSGINNATLYWTLTEGSNYTAVPMTATTQADHFEAYIPAQAAGTVIYYYIHAESNNGKQQVRPMTAPSGNFKFKVLDASTVSVSENAEAFGFGEIFPNPADVIVWIPIMADVEFNGKVQLFDMTGRLITTISNSRFNVGKNDLFLDISTLSQGVYNLVLTAEGVHKTAKLVVK